MAADIYKKTPQDRLSLEELDLYHRIIEYRASRGLDPLPLSASLTLTAGRHVVDIRENVWAEGTDPPRGANLHSWSDAPYYADHSTPEAMWEAPARLGTRYDAPGFEIFGAGYPGNGAALKGWQRSPAHDAVITETGIWEDVDLAVIGVGLDRSAGPGPYAGRAYSVWFGAEPDPAGAPAVHGTRAADRIAGTAFDDRIRAGAGSDRVTGGDGDDVIRGGGGGDEIGGGRGRDTLHAGSGRDSLDGGRGADRLVAGPGPEDLTGGGGGDAFVFRKAAHADGATITDFGRGADRLDLSAIDANANRAGHQDLSLSPRGGLAFEDGLLSGQVRGGPDFEIALPGVHHFGADDLLV